VDRQQLKLAENHSISSSSSIDSRKGSVPNVARLCEYGTL